VQWEDEEDIHSLAELIDELKCYPERWAVVGRDIGPFNSIHSQRWNIEGIETKTRPAKYGGIFRIDLLARWVGKGKK